MGEMGVRVKKGIKSHDSLSLSLSRLSLPPIEMPRLAFSNLLPDSLLGAGGSRSKEEMLKATAKLASDWTNSTIGADVVRNIVG